MGSKMSRLEYGMKLGQWFWGGNLSKLFQWLQCVCVCVPVCRKPLLKHYWFSPFKFKTTRSLPNVLCYIFVSLFHTKTIPEALGFIPYLSQLFSIYNRLLHCYINITYTIVSVTQHRYYHHQVIKENIYICFCNSLLLQW
jgi:hypothetical protein